MSHEVVACAVCGRTILKGERTEPYLVQDGSTRLVCELCTRRAQAAGWIPAGDRRAPPAVPPRAEPRRSLLGRLRRRPENGSPRHPQESRGWEEAEAVGGWRPSEQQHDLEPQEARFRAEADASPLGHEADVGIEPEEAADDWATRPERRSRRVLRDPRHVRAIPTTAEAKVERGLDLFNASDFQRTVAGLMRTLGQPWVSAVPLEDSPSEITVVVAWELSWYQYRVDLGDSADAVSLERKGREIDELEEPLRQWNAGAGPDGWLEPRTPAA